MTNTHMSKVITTLPNYPVLSPGKATRQSQFNGRDTNIKKLERMHSRPPTPNNKLEDTIRRSTKVSECQPPPLGMIILNPIKSVYLFPSIRSHADNGENE